ncbi:hypothetical protein E2C01_018944 [Portunus trituberculatus]|uniref:Uncharacterized protein n=1 Tax=Portunus trituberculatus TaxID=210409 RepID=A0A5B7DW00_PORTR|nr:hypothetical protein [Portunus trituberculatus]
MHGTSGEDPLGADCMLAEPPCTRLRAEPGIMTIIARLVTHSWAGYGGKTPPPRRNDLIARDDVGYLDNETELS